MGFFDLPQDLGHFSRRGAAHIVSLLVLLLMIGSILAISLYTTRRTSLKSKAANPVMLNLYVAPGGDDANDGLSADKPFKTLERARDVVRTFTANMTGDIVVNLRQGVYHLSQPFQLTNLDSGRNGYNVVWQNFTNEVPEISGGKVITGWQQDTGGKWKANVGVGVVSRQLYVNGVRAVRARSTDGLGIANKLGCLTSGWTNGSGCTGYADATAGTASPISTWKNLKNVEFVANKTWKQFRCPVNSITGGQIFLQQPCWNNSQIHLYIPSGTIVQDFTMGPVSWVENALELLDQPGYWYLDQSSGWLYYYPKSGENMATAEVILPILETLVSGTGTLDQPISNIRFKGIQFAFATWLQPSGAEGYADLQAGTLFKGNAYQTCDYRGVCGTLPNGAWPQSPASISFVTANNVGLENDNFIHLGSAAVNCVSGCKGFQVIGSHITDISGSGVRVGDVDQPNTTDDRLITRDTLIKDNFIHNVGAEYFDNVGIWLGYTQNSQVANNEIFDLPYSGMSMGWGWGRNDYAGGTFDNPYGNGTLITVAKNNAIKNNFIHDFANVLWDGGGIYTLSAQPTSTISGNRILNSKYGIGIYMDENSRFFELTRNSIWNVSYETLAAMGGGNRNAHDNYWQDRGDVSVTYGYPVMTATVPDVRYLTATFAAGTDNFSNNTKITDESQVLAAIISGAGLEATYASTRNSPCLPADMPTIMTPIGNVGIGNGTINLTWGAVSGAASYLLRVSDVTAGIEACSNSAGVCLSTPGTSYSLPVLAGHNYRWWVHGVSSCGLWGWPNIATFTAQSTPPPAAGPTVSGFVYQNGTSVGISGVKVELHIWAAPYSWPWPTAATTTTDSNGAWSLPYVVGNNYYVSAPAPSGYTDAPTNAATPNCVNDWTANWGMEWTNWYGADHRLPATGCSGNIFYKVSAGPTVSGFVYQDGTKVGIPGAKVELHVWAAPYSWPWPIAATTVTDSNGAWSLPFVVGNNYYVSAPAPSGYVDAPTNASTPNCANDWTANWGMLWTNWYGSNHQLPASGCSGNIFYKVSG